MTENVKAKKSAGRWRHVMNNINEFYLRTKSGISVRIPVNNKVTIITGDSATGKTKLVSYLSDLLIDKNEITETSVDLDSIIICKDKLDVEQLVKENVNNKLIFIDRFDTLDNEIISYISRTSCHFILFAHKDVPQCGYDYSSILEMSHDGTHYEGKRLFHNATEYLTNQTVLI